MTDARELSEQVQEHRHRHVVGQVRYQGVRGAGKLGHLQRIHQHHIDITRLLGTELLNGVRELPSQRRVDLHRDHVLRRVQNTEGQRAQTRADLQHRLL